MAGRLAYHLGSPRLAMWMHYRAWREDPTHPEACYYHGRALLERREHRVSEGAPHGSQYQNCTCSHRSTSRDSTSHTGISSVLILA